MKRLLLRTSGIAVLAMMLTCLLAPAASHDKEAVHTFKVTSDARIDMEAQGQPQKMEALAEFRYTWQCSGRERTLLMDALGIKQTVNGMELMNGSFSREKFVSGPPGAETEILFENAREELKTMLRDSFGSPLCKLLVDEVGKEVKRTVVAGPGAQPLINSGMIANALMFHPPFQPDKEEWLADVEVSIGHGGFANGKLTYRKVPGTGKGQTVKVSGTLINEAFKMAGTPITMKDARYVASGEQVFDLGLNEWVSGKLTMDVSAKLLQDDKSAGSYKGTMTLTFEKLTTLQEKGNKVLKTRDDVKAQFPNADPWLETRYKGVDYLFCAYRLPGYGDPPIEIHAWVFLGYKNQWEKLLSLRLRCGPVKLSVDPKTGLFTAKGHASNKFEDKPVCTIDLNATDK